MPLALNVCRLVLFYSAYKTTTPIRISVAIESNSDCRLFICYPFFLN